MELIYEFSNDGWTGVKWKCKKTVGLKFKGDAEGLCFGYSTIWCIKMQEHADKPLLTKPDQFGASILQQRVEQMPHGWRQSVQKLIALRGNSCGPELKGPWAAVPGHIAANPGHYIIDIGDHWVAGAYNGGTYAFFDANEGMTVFDDEAEFKSGIKAKLQTYKADPDPGNGWDDTHRIYKVTK